MCVKRVSILLILFLTTACQPVNNSALSEVESVSQFLSLLGSREYIVEQHLVLKNAGPGIPEKQNLWVALIRDFPPYQEIRSQIIEPQYYTLVTDEYGNRYAEFDLSDHPAGTETSEQKRMCSSTLNTNYRSATVSSTWYQPECTST
jgi:hypothetical protein